MRSSLYDRHGGRTHPFLIVTCVLDCRRLTIEEKTALYRVRPDLELTPTPVLLLELEETRRRKQRKLVFSVLGAALVLLMIVVFYYTVSQMDED